MIFVAKNLQASRVNVLQNDYAAGVPSPLSVLGLGDALVRDMELTPWSARTLPILHRTHVSPGRTKPEMAAEKDRHRFAPIETLEDLTARVEMSVLFDLPGCDSAHAVRQALTGRRIAGGVIENETLEVEAVTPDGSAFTGLRRGYAMIRPDGDRPERLRISTGDAASLSEVTHTAFPTHRYPGDGWIIPVAAGYHLIESPHEVPRRRGTRSPDVPHVFAEPVLGLAELISVRNERLRSLDEDGLSARLWSWDARDSWVLGHPDYHTHTMQEACSDAAI